MTVPIILIIKCTRNGAEMIGSSGLTIMHPEAHLVPGIRFIMDHNLQETGDGTNYSNGT